VNEDIYDLDIEKLQNDMINDYEFIGEFISLGQYKLKNKNNNVVILANTRIIPITNTFEKIKDNVWYGVMKKNNKINKSISVIYSYGYPNIYIPVFSSTFLRRIEDIDGVVMMDDINSIENDEDISKNIGNMSVESTDDDDYKTLFTIKEYGKHALNKYRFNTTSINANRKVYINAQGNIISDVNCITPFENVNKRSLNECNAFQSYDDLELNEQVDDDMNSFGKNRKKTKWFKKGETIVLKENDEPWFLNSNIVGDAHHMEEPHKITGRNDMNMLEFNELLDNDQQINMPYKSSCNDNETSIGYSRLDKLNKCKKNKNIEHYDDDQQEQIQYLYDFNTIVVIVLSFVFILLLIIAFKKKWINL
jgi:hypothetical protein